jgi:hydroxymethylglutaryl-CoA synthase
MAISGLMKKYNLKPGDFAKVVLYSPDARRYAELAKNLGFDAKTQVQDPLFMAMGNTGAAFPLMLLIAALEEAKPGDLILLASYGNGSDAFVLKVTEHIEKLRKNRLGMKGHLASKRVVDDYRKYLVWRGILPYEDVPGPVRFLSAPASWREAEANLRLQGVKCRVCGTIQFPPQRVCTNCRTKDQFEPYGLSGKKAKIFTFAMDYVTPFAQMPTVTTTIDFDGGGRMECYMTDAEPEQVKCGSEVEMSFRKIIFKEGAQVYFWKSMPVRG